jgi:GTP-binding protein
MNKSYRTVKFVLSASDYTQAPSDEGYEVAMAGRSNAGKSSALNTICDQKNLARISKTPGRTQLLNFFSVDDRRRLVDLPGYGYAEVSETVRREWQLTMGGFLEQRQCLKGIVLVMDIRSPLTKYDNQMLGWIIHRALPAHILLTKADKVGRYIQQQTLEKVAQYLEQHAELISVQLFSSSKKLGVDQAHALLDRWFDLEESHQ